MASAPDQEEAKVIRWGICGTGKIASDFVRCLKSLPDTEVAAVASRSAEGATRFGTVFGIARQHAGYEALAVDDGVDVVYVATPSARHVSDCLLFLESGKAVLCEKCMAPDSDGCRVVLAKAREKGLFFCHGVWSRFFPATSAIREALASGAIGDVVSAHASFCQNDGAGVRGSCAPGWEIGSLLARDGTPE